MRRVASSTPSTIGMPRSRAESRQMRCRTAEFGDNAADPRQNVIERRAGDARHQNVAGRDARELAFAIDDDGSARAPADPGRMSVEAGMLEPDLVGHMRAQRPASGRACSSLKPASSSAHSISTGVCRDCLGLAHQPPKRGRLPGAETRGIHKRFGHPFGIRAGTVRHRRRGDVCARFRWCGQRPGGLEQCDPAPLRPAQ